MNYTLFRCNARLQLYIYPCVLIYVIYLYVCLYNICYSYLTVTFDLFMLANPQGSVEEDPVALLLASHAAAQQPQVWPALRLQPVP